MATDNLVCWKCGAALSAVPLPLSRVAECPNCRAYLHVCRLCRLWNPHISEQCDEPRGEHPHNNDRPNFCDYFQPRPNAHRGKTAKTQAAKSALDSVFGAGSAPETESDPARAKLDDLFGQPENKPGK